MPKNKKNNAPKTTPPPPQQSNAQESIKETLESIVIAFILAFVFRAYVVEAFVIPTGSMAPTLLGRHLRVDCAQCGYQFDTDTPPNHSNAAALQHDLIAACPMCHFPNIRPKGTSLSAGDRILVHKFIYSLMEPKRWDVVVFKAPHDPNTNFIKRLIGLPNERLWIIEGNIYTQPVTDGPPQPWSIARKSSQPDVQPSVWQPIYHAQHAPLDNGQTSPGRAQFPWKQPWVPVNPKSWDLTQRNALRYLKPQTGIIRFDFQRTAEGSPGLFGYNQHKRHAIPVIPIEDVRIAASFLPQQPGLSVMLQTTARMDDPKGNPLKLTAKIDSQGIATLSYGNYQTNTLSEDVGPFTTGQARAVELWYVDQEASLWVDGQLVLNRKFDPPIAEIIKRLPPPSTPQITIEVQGSPVSIHRLELDRDLYYTSINPNGTYARGALVKTTNNHQGTHIELKKDQFFCLGDNSPLSHDSRFWSKVNPWIEARMFDRTEDQPDVLGIVPRRLLMGKAFFVYFPTPLQTAPRRPALIPNFGDMRIIR